MADEVETVDGWEIWEDQSYGHRATLGTWWVAVCGDRILMWGAWGAEGLPLAVIDHLRALKSGGGK